MKGFVLAIVCLQWAQAFHHNHEGYYMAYKYGLHTHTHTHEDSGLLHKREGDLHVRHAAEAVILSAEDQSELGRVYFHYNGTHTHINGFVSGLTAGEHGFHIHENGDLSNKCAGAGAHFNPEKKNHGGPKDADRHVGDLGNIKACEDGYANFNFDDHMVALDGPHNVAGRAVVVHADPDDLGKGGFKDSLTTGHAGARVACGIITPLPISH